ncbi:hypothetical protein N8482_01990 [Chitinophagales bacterium]|nr:hypothetical protein [Chitinophagales bacterium]
MRIICAILVIILITSCDFPTHYFSEKMDCIASTSFPLDKNFINADYRSSVINQLKDSSPDDFRYYFNSFTKEGKQVFMNVDFRNKNQCFNVNMLVERWDKLVGMYRTNGKAYPKELYDLSWILQDRKGMLTVVYEDMHKIID